MSDNYFGLDTDLPTLGARKFDEELLTADVEEEYDALNDETFGDGAIEEGDWEENHEKLAHLIDKLKDHTQEKRNSHKPLLSDFHFDGDDSHHEILEKSISQLGLEDDLDDPIIKAIGRPLTTTSSNSNPLNRIFGPSPPPPAILDSELCGSPKTCSIWSTSQSSTPVVDNERSSLYKSPPPHNSQENSHQLQHPSQVASFTGDSLPMPSSYFLNARTVEDLERDLLTATPTIETVSSSSSQWRPHSLSDSDKFKTPSDLYDKPVSSHKPRIPSYSPTDTWITPPTERLYHDLSQDKHCVNNWESQYSPVSIANATLAHDSESRTFDQKIEVEEEHNLTHKRGLPSCGVSGGRSASCSIGILQGPQITPVNPIRSPQRTSTPSRPALPSNLPPHPILNPRPLVNPFAVIGMSNNISRNNMPYSLPPHQPPRFNICNTKMADLRRMMLYPRQIHHPLLHRQQKNLWNIQNRMFSRRPDQEYRKDMDEYAGLMTQKEKEWLIKIQMMQLQTNDPYLDDYYFTTYNTKKLSQKIMNSSNGTKDGPKLLLPERIKQEPRTYVPTQFEKSLGKLQVISVNFPRKVLDISVSRPLEDDEGRLVTNQSLLRYRRLLLDIEKLYSILLEIDDEEKRMLALPEDAQESHKKVRDSLIEELFSGFYTSGSGNDEKFQHIMTVRKGRTLLMRALLVLTRLQQVTLLSLVFQCLSTILRKDQNDRVFLQHYHILTNTINKTTFAELVDMGEILENLPKDKCLTTGHRHEKSHYLAAMKNKCGSTIVCFILQHGEHLYAEQSFFDPELQSRWTRVVLHVVDILCSLPDDAIVEPAIRSTDLLSHFQRFPIERDKFEVLKAKLCILNPDIKAGGDFTNEANRISTGLLLSQC